MNGIDRDSEELRIASFLLKFKATTPEIIDKVIDHGFGLSCNSTVINVESNEDTSLVEKAWREVGNEPPNSKSVFDFGLWSLGLELRFRLEFWFYGSDYWFRFVCANQNIPRDETKQNRRSKPELHILLIGRHALLY
jgi:hypothetical protein